MANASAPTVGRVNTHPILSLAPGLAMTAGITLIAYALRYIPGVEQARPDDSHDPDRRGDPQHHGQSGAAVPGIQFSLKRILRFSIILIGLQITAQQAAEVGFGGIAIIATGLLSTLAVTMLVGRLLGIRNGLALLIERRRLDLRRLRDRRRQDRDRRRG